MENGTRASSLFKEMGLFEKSQINGCKVRYCVFLNFLCLVFLSMMSNEVHASLIFLDDFEEGNSDGWLESWQQGQWGEATGSWDVVYHNKSNMARVQHKTDGFHAFTQNFTYIDDSILSFDMQISGQADINAGNHAGGHVAVSFLNKFNVKLGSVSLIYSTSPSSINPAYRVDSNLHHYSASMSEWADFADLVTTDNVSTLSLSFVAWGQQDSWLQAGSTGTVWFDNVKIEIIPEPTTLVLFAIGTMLAPRKRNFNGRHYSNILS